MVRSFARYIAICLFFIQVLKVEAHPGIGMVYDGNNVIYYTDLEHIWKYNLIDGKASIVISNVHSHELCMDSLGNLYGEHYYYVEEDQQFKNYIWAYSNKMGLSILRQEKDGENTDFSFIRDKDFNTIQFSVNGELTEIRRIYSDSSHLIAKHTFKDIRWKSLNQHDELLIVDLHSLYKIDHTDRIEQIAEDLSSTKFPFSFNDEKHNVYGVWSDDRENTYVAIYGGREIKRINKHREVSTIYKSSFFWSPLNGLFDKDGQLWVLEGSLWGDTRISLVELSDKTHSTSLLIWLFFALILMTTILILRRNRKTVVLSFGIH